MSRYFRAAMIMCEGCKEWIPKRRRPCHRCGVIPLIPGPKRPVKARHTHTAKPRIILPALSDRSLTFVYLITDGKYCKIGFAKDLTRRLLTLQNATPYSLRLVDAVETAQPRALEAFLHGLFAAKHHRNEWFKLIGIEEWRTQVEAAKALLSTATSSGISSTQQDQLNTGSI
jgi:hypothetical protein